MIRHLPTLLLIFASFGFASCGAENPDRGHQGPTKGYSLTLEVAGDEIIRALAFGKADSLFESALEKARNSPQREEIGWVNAFADAMLASDEDVKLAPYFAKYELPIPHFLFQRPLDPFDPRPTKESSNEKVVDWLTKEIDAVVERTFNVLRHRVDRLGISQPNMWLEKVPGRFVIDMRVEGDHNRIRNAILRSAQLGFWKAASYGDCLPTLIAINAFHGGTAEPVTFNTPVLPPLPDDLPPENPFAQWEDSAFKEENRFLGLLEQLENFYPDWQLAGLVREQDTAEVSSMIAAAERANVTGRHKFLWMAQPERNDDPQADKMVGLACILLNEEGRPDLDGKVITEARAEPNDYGGFQISINMNAEGARNWAYLTSEQVGKLIAMVLDGKVLSVPRVQSEIRGGRSVILGDFTFEEAKDLAAALESGALPVTVRVVEERSFGE